MYRNICKLCLIALITLLGWQAYASSGMIFTFTSADDVSMFYSGYSTCPIQLTHDAATGEMVVTYDYSSAPDGGYYGEINNDAYANWDMDQYKYFSMKFTVAGYVPSDAGFFVRVHFIGASAHVWVDSDTFSGDGTYILRYDLSGDANYTGTGNRVAINLPCEDQYADWANATVRVDWIAITDDPSFDPTVAPGGDITSNFPGGAANVGDSVTLTAPEGSDYQWYKGATLLEGQTAQTLVLDPATETDSGAYRCQYNNGSEMVTTNVFVLTIALQEVPVMGLSGLAMLTALSLVAGVIRNRRK